MDVQKWLNEIQPINDIYHYKCFDSYKCECINEKKNGKGVLEYIGGVLINGMWNIYCCQLLKRCLCPIVINIYI